MGEWTGRLNGDNLRCVCSGSDVSPYLKASYSSVGQSTCLTSRGSLVRAQHRPPYYCSTMFYAGYGCASDHLPRPSDRFPEQQNHIAALSAGQPKQVLSGEQVRLFCCCSYLVVHLRGSGLNCKATANARRVLFPYDSTLLLRHCRSHLFRG
jgi:hypothetical protein